VGGCGTERRGWEGVRHAVKGVAAHANAARVQVCECEHVCALAVTLALALLLGVGRAAFEVATQTATDCVFNRSYTRNYLDKQRGTPPPHTHTHQTRTVTGG
jgi:hypothetical protein